MNINPAISNQGLLLWDGKTSYPRSLVGATGFGLTFNVTADIVTDAVFTIESAPPSAVNPCDPGAFSAVTEIRTCGIPSDTNTPETITIPAKTPAASICTGTLPCPPDAFIRLIAKSGDTGSVQAVLVIARQ